jgi:hypothetical protein
MKRPAWMAPWQRLMTAAAPEPAVRTVPRPQRRLGGTYHPLHAYLHGRFADTTVLTFEQIESLLGFALPERARTHDEWWTGHDEDAGPSEAWLLAGRRATPNIHAGIVSFDRVSS